TSRGYEMSLRFDVSTVCGVSVGKLTAITASAWSTFSRKEPNRDSFSIMTTSCTPATCATQRDGTYHCPSIHPLTRRDATCRLLPTELCEPSRHWVPISLNSAV